MKLDDATTEYLVDEIIDYYGNDQQRLINIFTLNQEIFGKNFYGNIPGDSFNSKVVNLVKELTKRRKLKDFITIVRKKTYPVFANKYVGELLIQILNEIFTEEPDKFLKFYQLFISHLNISHLNISKKIKEIIPEVETSEDITKFINVLMQIDEEQEDSYYVETFVYFIIEASSFQENKLREWSKKYIKDYNGPKKPIPKPFSNIFRKIIFSSKFIFILPLIILSLLLYSNGIFNSASIGILITQIQLLLNSNNYTKISPKVFVEKYYSAIKDKKYKESYYNYFSEARRNRKPFDDHRFWWEEQVIDFDTDLSVISENSNNAKVNVEIGYLLFVEKNGKLTREKKYVCEEYIILLISQNNKWLINEVRPVKPRKCQ